MHPELAKLSKHFPGIEIYIMSPSSEYADAILDMTPQELHQFTSERSRALALWQDTYPKIYQLLPELSPQEVITAYEEGNPLLKMLLGSYMHIHFDPAYIPVMKTAIYDNTDESYLFLDNLSAQLSPAELLEIVAYVLDQNPANDEIKRNIETALGIVGDRQLVELIEKIRALSRLEDEVIAGYASEILKLFKNNPLDKEP